MTEHVEICRQTAVITMCIVLWLVLVGTYLSALPVAPQMEPHQSHELCNPVVFSLLVESMHRQRSVQPVQACIRLHRNVFDANPDGASPTTHMRAREVYMYTGSTLSSGFASQMADNIKSLLCGGWSGAFVDRNMQRQACEGRMWDADEG